jgi:hypothetical protein
MKLMVQRINYLYTLHNQTVQFMVLRSQYVKY